MMKRIASLLTLAFSLCSGFATAAPIYADAVVVENVTYFGSGTLVGAPDGGGAFLSNTFDPPTLLGSITAQFSGGLVDGAGIDLFIHEIVGPAADETADVFVSTDGIAFTFLGVHGNFVTSFDFNGIFAGVVNFVKIVNTSQTNSPDIDAFEGFYAADANVPEPASLAIFMMGLLGLGLARKRIRK